MSVDKVIDNLTAQREEIKKKLEKLSEVNKQLELAVRETQAISVKLIEKLNKELKVAKKSITSICSKLKEGVILVDASGKIIQLNPAGEKLFGIKNKVVVGKQFQEVIAWLDPIIIDGHETQKVIMAPEFFEDLSSRLLNDFKSWDPSVNRYVYCNECLKKEVPGLFDLEKEKVLSAYSSCQQEPVEVTFTFSILDNDPNDANDLIYIFIFRRAPPSGQRRRYYEKE